MESKIVKVKIVDNRLEQYGMIVYARQFSGMETMYDANINGKVYTFHITQLELD